VKNKPDTFVAFVMEALLAIVAITGDRVVVAK
jgi:hypothetical protein